MADRARRLEDLLLGSADRHPTDLAIASPGSQATYGELRDSALCLASTFVGAGVRPGDRIAIAMTNGVPAVVSTFACLFAGGAFVLVNPEATRDTLDAILRTSGATVLVTETGMASRAAGARDRVPTLRTVVSRGPLPDDGVIDFHAAVAEGTADLRSAAGRPSDLAALVFTSGTSGEPKGVMMHHRNLVFLAGSIAGYLGLGRADRILSVLSLAHTYGLSWLIASMRQGAGLFLEPSFAYPAKVQQRIDEEAVTVFPGVPTVFTMLLSLNRRTPLRFPSVTTVTCAGGALLPSVHDGMRTMFPAASIIPMYGQTECMRVSYLDPTLVADKPTSCGKAIPGTETVVLSDDGTPVAPGEIGILHVRGPHVTEGYFRDPERTSEILRDGPLPGEKMLCTHDLFRTDEDGFLYFVGRSDEIIKTRGEKVSPVEVEDALHAIDGIREAAVVGVPDDVLGEAVRAYVVLEHDTSLSERDLIAACRGSLEPFKVPKQIIVLDDLPKTPTGKIMKRALAPQPQ